MRKREVLVLERRGPRCRNWSIESVCWGEKPRTISREWVGMDGAKYRYFKYVPAPECGK